MAEVAIYTREQVSKHNTEQDMWIIIDNIVYDVTKFARFHPGGLPILVNFAGKDCSGEFRSYHNDHVLSKYKNLVVGKVIDTQLIKAKAPFVYAEPAWYNPEAKSPFYKQTHIDFRNKVRKFVDEEIMPFCHEWDTKGEYPADLREKAYKAGIYAAIYPKEYGGTPPQDFDAFHDLILIDELSRCACGGLLWSCFFSFGISIPPVLAVGSKFIKDKVASDVLSGKKLMSLCVTEPAAGSDVMNLQTTAKRVRNQQGEEVWEIFGEKRYITGGVKADYYTVLARTDVGLTLILVERERPGVVTRRQPTQGWLTSNTAFVQFNKVQVPINHLIGKEGEGWKATAHNFNHERFTFAAMANRMARVCLADAVEFARARKTFNKPLSTHQTIRHKIAEMAGKVELVHSYLEFIASQMNQGRINNMGGEMALAKAMATDSMDYCTLHATQIFGGCAYIKNGAGERVERLTRETGVMRIAGGSREVLLDLVLKQAKL